MDTSLIFASCRDCPSYLASAKTIRDILLHAETTIHEIWFPAETVCVILLPAESQQEAKSHGQSLQEAIYQTQLSAGSKRLQTVSVEPNMTDSLCRERKLVDSFIPCLCPFISLDLPPSVIPSTG